MKRQVSLSRTRRKGILGPRTQTGQYVCVCQTFEQLQQYKEMLASKPINERMV